MNILDPWAPIVLQDNFTDVDFDAVIKRFKSIQHYIIADINSPLEHGGTSSVAYSRISNDKPHMWEELKPFETWLHGGVLDTALTKWRINGVAYGATDSWINEHPTGAWTSEHNHRGANFSLAYYLHVPENGGNIMFRDPMEYHWGNANGTQDRGVDEIWYPAPVKTGDLVLFPGWLYHKTEKNNSLHPRYVLSMNFSAVRIMYKPK